MKTIIVTGANGFIGQALLNVLTRKKRKIFAIVHNSGSDCKIKETSYVHIIQCDMENLLDLPKLISGKADIFFHLAWDGSSGEKRKDCERQLKNVQWTVDAVRVAAELECRRFVGVGSLVEYDVASYIPMNGSAPEPVHFYAAAKLAAHYMSKINAIGIRI